MNELKGRYSPATYHVNNAQSVLVRLEGSILRISRPAKAVLKHAFHEDPTLTQPQPTMVSQTIYSLDGARVSCCDYDFFSFFINFFPSLQSDSFSLQGVNIFLKLTGKYNAGIFF
ncbi:hypothetical protein NECAME_19346 [Necator americanus]|uniref:Uncharacterized protein n=1 Tax=Necator americanus TaxID=51031 RepID=W2SP13_NECAM|nr:hypothetical protein NECAME_19346 [Necator americanus]ETN71429.1 hypothetical protein NECAME_19346 [Necator americanus]